MPGQEFIHRSMWHREEDKASVHSPRLLEEDECFLFRCPFFFKENLLKMKRQTGCQDSLFPSCLSWDRMICGGFGCMTKANGADFIQCHRVIFLLTGRPPQTNGWFIVIICLSVFAPSLPRILRLLMRAGSSDGCKIEAPLLFPSPLPPQPPSTCKGFNDAEAGTRSKWQTLN